MSEELNPNDGGNGKEIKQEKTEEQLASERFSRYQKDPNTFIELSEIICCAIRNPKSQLGVSILVGNCKRSELDIGEVELTHRISLARRQMDIEAEMKKQGRIQPAKGGFLNGVRNLRGKR